ncbi:MAG: hypothetical protein ACOY3P_16155 [Planctomycetota bacterium]
MPVEPEVPGEQQSLWPYAPEPHPSMYGMQPTAYYSPIPQDSVTRLPAHNNEGEATASTWPPVFRPVEAVYDFFKD